MAVHAWVILILLLVDLRPHGDGLGGGGSSDAFAVTWVPGIGRGPGQQVETILPGDGDADNSESETTIDPQPAKKHAAIFDVESADPQTVFNSDSAESILQGTTVTPASARQIDADHQISDSRKFENTDSVSEEMGEGDAAAADADRGKGNGKSGDEAKAGGSSRGDGQQVSFFGIGGQAKRVVFAIDASESMKQHRAMELARQELWASLQGLPATSQFQIVFFSLTNSVLERPGEKSKLMLASSGNLRLAKLFLTGIQPESGTDRFAAITRALSFDPDVIYLLTDADAPGLSAKDLWNIKQANRRSAKIHVIEFGIGGDLSQDSFLKKLTRQNAGIHQYVDLVRSERETP